MISLLSAAATVLAAYNCQLEPLRAVTLSATKDKLHVAEQRTMMIEAILAAVKEAYDELETKFPDRSQLRALERSIIVRAIDSLWIDHLSAMTALRHGIGLQGYGQRDPLVEYKKESFQMFQRLLAAINQEVVFTFFKAAAHAVQQQAQMEIEKSVYDRAGVQLQGASDTSGNDVSLRGGQQADEAISSGQSKIGRNDPCPCGSGKKWKQCGLLNTPEHVRLMAGK